MQKQPKNLREQLMPIAAKLREGHSIIRPISQVIVRLKPISGRDRFSSAIDEILRWMNKRAGRTLPAEAWQQNSFELSDIGAQRTAAVALKDPKFWSARLDDADKNVPLRTWVTEIGVALDGDQDVLFGARLICATRGADSPFDRSIPGFVRHVLLTGPAELDGAILSGELRMLSSESDVLELVRLLENPSRQSDVIVFSLPEASENPADAAASAFEVHKKTFGVAHVFVISGRASFILSDNIGSELSVYRQAVRTYRPGFRSWVDEPSRHPVALPNKIASWNGEGPDAFVRWIVSQALRRSVENVHREERLPSFNTVRQLAAHDERAKLKESGASESEILKLYEQDNEQLRRELKEQKEQYDGLLVAADNERQSAVESANAAKAQALERLYRIQALKQRLKQSPERSEIPIPNTLENFEDWYREHLIGAVEITNRAFQGIKKSEFHDPTFIYRALLILRDFYVPMRVFGTRDLREAYQNALQGLQLEESHTGDGIKYSADLYSVQYGGGRRALDRHLKGRDSRDRRYGFRLYFFWDEEGEVAVVGWLPSHLDNKAT